MEIKTRLSDFAEKTWDEIAERWKSGEILKTTLIAQVAIVIALMGHKGIKDQIQIIDLQDQVRAKEEHIDDLMSKNQELREDLWVARNGIARLDETLREADSRSKVFAEMLCEIIDNNFGISGVAEKYIVTCRE